MDGSGEPDIFSGVVDPNQVSDLYHETNPWGVQPGTIKSYRSRLRYFRRFCQERGFEDLRDFQPTHIDEYQKFLRAQPRSDRGKTVKDCLATLRKFVSYCERREVFDPGFHEFVFLPDLSDNEGINETWLPREAAKEIVDHLATLEPFTREHVVWVLLNETGIPQSTLDAFDLDDYHSNECYIEAVNAEGQSFRIEGETTIAYRSCHPIQGRLLSKVVTPFGIW